MYDVPAAPHRPLAPWLWQIPLALAAIALVASTFFPWRSVWLECSRLDCWEHVDWREAREVDKSVRYQLLALGSGLLIQGLLFAKNPRWNLRIVLAVLAATCVWALSLSNQMAKVWGSPLPPRFSPPSAANGVFEGKILFNAGMILLVVSLFLMLMRLRWHISNPSTPADNQLAALPDD